MPNVPDISVGVTPLQGLPNARFNTEAPLEAFGGGASLEGVDRAVQGVGNAAADIARQEKEKADQLAVMSASRKAMELQTQLQVKASQMRGRDALGAPDMVDKEWQGGVSKITQGLSNDQQQLAFAHYASSAYGELNKSTSLHVAGEIREFDENETQSLLDTSRNAAVLNAYDTKRVGDELDKQSMALETWAGRNGIPTDSQQFKDRLQDTKSKTLSAVIEQRLASGQDKAAQELFTDSKDSLSAADTIALQHKIEATKTLQTSFDTWQKVKGLRLANGDPDEARMQSAVMSNPDLSNEQKLKVLDFVQSQAKIETYERRAHDASQERGLLNAALGARKTGAPLADALKLVNNYEWDNESEAVMRKQVQQIYSPTSVKSDTDTVLNLWQGIRQGSSGREDVRKAFLDGKIDDHDYRQLNEQWLTGQQKAETAAEKNAWDKVKTLATTTYPKDSAQQKNFLNTVRELGQGKSADEIWDLAQKETKDDPATKTGIFFHSYEPQWKTDMSRLNAESATMGKLQNDLGKGVVTAIGQGALFQKAKGAGPAYPAAKWGPGDVDEFAKAFGGYDNVKAGTPVNNAIQSLQKRGLYATPANVKAVLGKYPDGVY